MQSPLARQMARASRWEAFREGLLASVRLLVASWHGIDDLVTAG